MRILHLSSLYPPYSVGGAERVVEMLAEGTAAAGFEVGVAHLAPKRLQPERRRGVDVLPLAHRNPLWIEASAKSSSVMRKLNKIATLFNPLTTDDFATVLDAYKPEVVHSHSMVELTPRMWKLARDRGIKSVHTLHDYDLLCIRAALFMDQTRCEKQHLTCAVFSKVKQHYHDNIDHVVGVSRAILQTHLDFGLFQGISSERRHVVWNPVRPPPKATPKPREGPYTFGFLGRLVPEKGIVPLLEACSAIEASGWQLKIAGKAPKDDGFLRERLRSLPIELMGFVDPAVFFQSIDMLIVPSIWLEPFGLTILEAYAAGVPVIGADIGGVAEIVGAVDPGALFPPNDAGALAIKMDGLVRRGRIKTLAGEYSAVLQRTRPEHVVSQYLDIYRAALKR
jgi:glycogen(starch) synthase